MSDHIDFKAVCQECNGEGVFVARWKEQGEEQCDHCSGRGWKWDAIEGGEEV